HRGQDPEKACPGLDPGWEPVFGKDHAQTKSWTMSPIQPDRIMVQGAAAVEPGPHCGQSTVTLDQKLQSGSARLKPTDSVQDQRIMGIAAEQAYDASDRRKENQKGEQHDSEQFRVQVDPCGVRERGLVCLAGNERADFGLSKGSAQICSV